MSILPKMHLIKLAVLLNFGFIVSGALFGSDTYYFGSCPNVTPRSTFNKHLINGTWYEQERYYARAEPRDSCALNQFSINPHTGHLDISCLNRSWRGAERYKSGTAYPQVQDNTTSKFLAHYPYNQDRWENWFVLDTDYANFAIIWSCSQSLIWFTPQCRILTRQKSGSQHTINECRHNAYNRGASIWYLQSTGRYC